MRIVVACVLALVIVIAAFAALGTRNAPRRFDGPVEAVKLERVGMRAPSAIAYNAASAGVSKYAQPSSTGLQSRTRAGANGPQIAREAQLDVSVTDVQRAQEQVVQIARAEGGYIFSLHSEAADNGTPRPLTSTLELRVPATRFDAVLSGVTPLGSITRRVETAEDLSDDITDATARLRNLRRTEGDMLRIMDRSGRIDDIVSVENQLSAVREQIETLEASLRAQHLRVAYATIDVTLHAIGANPSSQLPVGAQLQAQWQYALRAVVAFTVAIASALLWLVAFVPYVIAVIVAGAVARKAWGRRSVSAA